MRLDSKKINFYDELMSKKSERGSILAGALAITAVLLTIGLAVVSRSVTDINISTETEEAVRTFSAAEAGIEKALSQTSLAGYSSSGPIGGVDVNVTVQEINSFEAEVNQDETAEVNLEGFSGLMTVKFDGSGEALVAALISASGIDRWAIKRDATNCNNKAEGFSITDNLQITVPGGAGKKILRLRPLCANAKLVVEAVGGASLPAQSYLIRSEARASGGETRVVETTKTYPILPEIFDFVLFSGGDLVK